MKFYLKKFVFCLLIVTVFLSGVFCCCVTDFAQADTEEILPPCYQAAHADEPAQSADECDCDNELAVLEKKPVEFDNIQSAVILTAANELPYQVLSTHLIYDYHPPPDIHGGPPIYIKHSILRI